MFSEVQVSAESLVRLDFTYTHTHIVMLEILFYEIVMLPLNQIFLSQNLKGNQWGTQSNEWSAPGERGTATTNRYVSELSIALDTSQQLRNKPENKGRLHYQSDLLQHFHLSPSFRLAEFGPSTCAVTKALIRAYPEEVRWEIAPSNFHFGFFSGETFDAHL